MDLMTRRRILLAQSAQESGVLATATGNPMTFTTDLKRTLKSLVIPFTSSVGKVDITHRGKNLVNAVDIYSDATSRKVGSVRRFELFVPNGVYTVSTNCAYTSGLASIFVGSSFSYTDTMTTSGNGCSPTAPKTLTVSDGIIVIGVRADSSAGGLVITEAMLQSGEIQIQVEQGSAVTAYERYNGNNFEIDWQSDIGLVSSGELTLNDDGGADLDADGNNYHFTNVGKIITLNGINVIWTDTNGTNTATYLKHQS